MQGVSIDEIKSKSNLIKKQIGDGVSFVASPYKKGFGLFLIYHNEDELPENIPESIEGFPVVGADYGGYIDLY